MRGTIAIRTELRRDPAARSIAQAWRRLTGGTGHGRDAQRRTLIACSGGADSCGLAIALWAMAKNPCETLVLAHVLHDLRSLDEVERDWESVQALGERLGLEVCSARVKARGQAQRNLEASARIERYRALAELAESHSCPFIVTAHHADDQLESVLMALVRGAGLSGLSGVAEARLVAGSETRVIRPSLGARRTDLQRLCTVAGWEWREDATNADRSRVRSRIRHEIAPLLEQIRPGVAIRASTSAALARGAARLVTARAATFIESDGACAASGVSYDRAALQAEPDVVIGEVIRLAIVRHNRAAKRDQLGSRVIQRVVAAIRSQEKSPRRFGIGGVAVEVRAKHVVVATSPSATQLRASTKPGEST